MNDALFSVKPMKLNNIRCNDENIQALPFDSFMKVLTNKFNNSVIKKDDLGGLFNSVNNDKKSCAGYWLIKGDLIFVSAQYTEIDPNKCCIYNFGYDKRTSHNSGEKTLLTVPTVVNNSPTTEVLHKDDSSMDDAKKEIGTISNDANENKSAGMMSNTVNIKSGNKTSEDVLGIASIIRERYRDIIGLNKACYVIHSYEEFKNSENKEYPYIYQKNNGYEIIFDNGRVSSCKSELGIKLYASLYEDAIVRQKIKQYLDILDSAEMYQGIVAFSNNFQVEKIKKAVEYMKIETMMKLFENNNREV